jgi:7-carboxy-7-deazaguanine synthase
MERPPRDRRLRMSELYVSVQGESTHVGKPCVFVRLTGCNLRCTWCDSTFTFTGGDWRDLDEVVAEVAALGVHTVEVTGGEPLLQPNVNTLMARLLEAGHEVLLETSGSLSIAPVPPGVHIILDLKPPGSGEVDKNLWSNLDLLQPHHEVKAVLTDRSDYEWARDIVRAHGLTRRCTVLFSPVWGQLAPQDLVRWILDDRLDVRFQLQLHKVVWEPDARGV